MTPGTAGAGRRYALARRGGHPSPMTSEVALLERPGNRVATLCRVPRSTTPPGRPGGSATRLASLVMFTFGVLPDGSAIPGSALIRVLADFGVGSAAARSGLSRMVARGDLSATRAGRGTTYTLGPATVAVMIRSHAELSGRATEPTWDGRFHGLVYRSPENQRWFRDAIRHLARTAGYAQVEPGLMISPWDRYAELGQLLERTPPGARVLRTQLTFSAADAVTVCAEAWSLAARAHEMTSAIERLERQLAGPDPPTPGPAGLWRYADASLGAFRAMALDPRLPAEVRPADWPGPQLLTTLRRAARHYGPSATAYLTDLIATDPRASRRHGPDSPPT